MKIVFLLTRRVPDRPSPILLEVADRLRAAGHDVEGWIPEDRILCAHDLGDLADLYVLKSHTEHALSYACALAAAGARVLNDLPACLAAQDKVTAAGRMRSAGVPTPDTWLVHNPSSAVHLVDSGPLIVKPNRGHRGAGVHLVSTPQELATVPQAGGPLIVQRHVPGPGEDLKVYVAGDQVWAVRKSFDELSFTRPGRPVAASPEVRELAGRVRTAFGLELFGVDVIESPDGPAVVDVNYFPGYKGCPDPAPAITDVVLAALHDRAT
ncbi:ATP-grasp domain-containing protein [Ornithinimicrobium sp. Y1847]|uniref:ATP-grasp domain-containing protein n=1 Tax=unclassified Ornithinimicrobium TaxID=2615080 RepID=UPI003B67E75C